jgi:3-phosphoshikimate 1-carboxyvinyltransferase
MKLIVRPSPPLTGSLELPGDKSLSHRAVLFAAVAKGTSRIVNIQKSGVVLKMLEAVRQLGVEWELKGYSLEVSSPGIDGWQAPKTPIDCGNSATTLRLLAGALAASGLPAVLDGTAGLRSRPMSRIIVPLQRMGVKIHGSQKDTPPLILEARQSDQKLVGIEYILPVASAQVKSCLLLAGLKAGRPLILHEPSASRDHTERMLLNMGVKLESAEEMDGHRIVLYPPSNPLPPMRFDLPGDLSSAAFILVAALIVPGSQITITRVGLNPGRTGLLEVLGNMGADIRRSRRGEGAGEPYGDVTARFSTLHSASVSGGCVVRMIDEFPIFAVAAAFAHGKTTVSDALELRYKESDRIHSLCNHLSRLGCCITEQQDGFIVEGPAELLSTEVQPDGDHRIAMALAVAGLAGTGTVTVRDSEIITESYPEFVDHLTHLGARLEMAGE